MFYLVGGIFVLILFLVDGSNISRSLKKWILYSWNIREDYMGLQFYFIFARIMNKLNKILDLKWEICALYIAEMVGCIVTKVVEKLVLPKSLFSVSI